MRIWIKRALGLLWASFVGIASGLLFVKGSPEAVPILISGTMMHVPVVIALREGTWWPRSS